MSLFGFPFGSGSGPTIDPQGTDQAQGTGSMWLRMFGLEELWNAANSPDFQKQIAQVIAAILETNVRAQRIEYKLDALLDRLGPEFADVARRLLQSPDAGLPATDGAAGIGGRSPATGAAHDDGGGIARADDLGSERTATDGGRHDAAPGIPREWVDR
jgi:hypothetical protein